VLVAGRPHQPAGLSRIEKDTEMTLEESDAEPASDAPAETTRAKPDRRRSSIDTAARTVTITDPDGTSLGTFALSALSDQVTDWLALDGLRARLRMGDPAAEFAALKKGEVPSAKSAARKDLDPWREAYAHALADERAKSQGVQKSRGGKSTPEYEALLEQARSKARGLDKAGLATIKRVHTVVAHHARLTDTVVSLADIT
jgi:hypothetical protein